MPEPIALQDDRCPRCGGGFHCGAKEPGPCPCTAITLGEALLADLRQRYRGCLCLRCLAELSAADGARGGGLSANGASTTGDGRSTAPSRAP